MYWLVDECVCVGQKWWLRGSTWPCLLIDLFSTSPKYSELKIQEISLVLYRDPRVIEELGGVRQGFSVYPLDVLELAL